MDYIALAGANCFLKRGKNVKRLLLTAVISSLCSLLAVLLISDKDLRLLVMHFLVNTIMVFLAFGRCRKKDFVENWAVMYLMVILLGGLLEWGNGAAGISGSFWAQAVAAAVFLSVVTRYLGRRKQFGNQIFPAVIKNREKSIHVYAYWDSGNQLKDPYSGRPVSILGKKEAEKLYEMEKDGIRYVPYCSLGETGGLLPVFTVDTLMILDGKKEMVMESAVVGIADEGLMEQKEYDLILHASLLQG